MILPFYLLSYYYCFFFLIAVITNGVLVLSGCQEPLFFLSDSLDQLLAEIAFLLSLFLVSILDLLL